MAFEDNIKKITPELTDIVSNTPAVKVGDKVLVAGIGGNFIPGAMGGDAYVVVDDNGVLKAQKLSFNGTEASFDGTAETLDVTKVGLFATTQDEPAYKGSGSAFYKCASVDADAKTWTGYLAVLGEDGTYSFEETATEGLSYTSVTPAVGKVYTEDALVAISSLYAGIPVEGLVFYLPLVEESTTTETGQTVARYGTTNYQTIQGIPFCNMSDGDYLEISGIGRFPSGDSDRALSLWFYASDVSTPQTLFTYGDNDANAFWAVELRSGHITIVGGMDISAEWQFEPALSPNTVYHIVIMHSNSSDILYLNNEYVGTFSYQRNTGLSKCRIFIGVDQDRYTLSGTYTAAIRLYNKALTEDQIQKLASEFIPTA